MSKRPLLINKWDRLFSSLDNQNINYMYLFIPGSKILRAWHLYKESIFYDRVSLVSLNTLTLSILFLWAIQNTNKYFQIIILFLFILHDICWSLFPHLAHFFIRMNLFNYPILFSRALGAYNNKLLMFSWNPS